MIRSYRMTVGIQGFDPRKSNIIKRAAEKEWVFFFNWHECQRRHLFSTSEGYLPGGETEDAFARRLAKAIWAANGGYCEVEVVAVCLENLPSEKYSFREDDYTQLESAATKSSEAHEGRGNG